MTMHLPSSVPCLMSACMLLTACETASKKQLNESQFMASLTPAQIVAEQDTHHVILDACATINESPACGTI